MTFTAETKTDLVRNLQVGVENGSLKIPTRGPFAVLVQELRDYEYKLLPSGRMTFSAPEGLHDDCVTALMLAYWGATRGGGGFESEPNFRL